MCVPPPNMQHEGDPRKEGPAQGLSLSVPSSPEGGPWIPAGCPRAPSLSKWVSELAGPCGAQLLSHLLRVCTRPSALGLLCGPNEEWVSPFPTSQLLSRRRCPWPGPMCLDMLVHLCSELGCVGAWA